MLPSNERSAEWLRAKIEALEELNLLTGFGVQWAENTRKACQVRVDEHLSLYRSRLAAAEAREAGDLTVTPDWADAMAYAISGRVSPGVLTITNGEPTAAAVIAACERACAYTGSDIHTATELTHVALDKIARWKEANGGK
tara:strand:+ start:264 stop:686 length:423 start_codon:yes stop_codon:yes gene_type:complete